MVSMGFTNPAVLSVPFFLMREQSIAIAMVIQPCESNLRYLASGSPQLQGTIHVAQ